MLKVKEEQLRVDTLLGENTTQSVFQATVDLPTNAPDVERVIWFKGKPILRETQVAEDKVVFEGVIDLQLVYLSQDEEGDNTALQQVRWQGAIPFNHYLEVIGAEPGMEAKCGTQVLSIDWEIRPDQRSFDVDVLTLLEARVYEEASWQVVTNASVKAPQKLEVDDVVINRQVVVDSLSVHEKLDGKLDVPEGYEKIHTVLEVKALPQVWQQDVKQSKAEATGDCRIELVYADEEMGVHHLVFENKVPFELLLENEGFNSQMKLEAKLDADTDYMVVDDGGTIEVQAEITGELAVSQLVQHRAVLELTSPSGNQIETRKEQLRLDTLVNEKSQLGNAHGVIELDDEYPPIREILYAEAIPQVSDYRVEEDKVYLEGTVDVEIAYLAHTEEESKPLYYGVFKNAAQLQQVIAIGGVEPGMHCVLDVKVETLTPDLINRETVEIDISFKAHAAVSKVLEEEVVVEAIEVTPPEEDPPTITYVIVQPADTLWKLAKRYHTTEEAIINANPWLRDGETQTINTMDKLCIPRKQPIEQ